MEESLSGETVPENVILNKLKAKTYQPEMHFSLKLMKINKEWNEGF